MRDDEVARAGGLPDAASPSPKELDRRIDIVAADSARAPDSHVRRQLLFRLIRYLCRAMRRRRNRIVANQEGRISVPKPSHQRQHCQMNCCAPFRMVHMANWGHVQRPRVLPYGSRTSALSGTRSIGISAFEKISPAVSVGGIAILPASELDKSVQHGSRRAAVPNCTRSAD